MKTNIGMRGRLIRVAAALVLFALGIVYHSWWGLLGFIPLVIALSGFCWACALRGLCTRKSDSESTPAA